MIKVSIDSLCDKCVYVCLSFSRVVYSKSSPSSLPFSLPLFRKADDRDSRCWRGGEGRRHGDSEVLGLRLPRPSVHLEALGKRGTVQSRQAEIKIQHNSTGSISFPSVQFTGVT